MGKLTDAFTAVATSLTPDSRRDEAQKFTRMLRNVMFENNRYSRAGNWLSQEETARLGKDPYMGEIKSQLEETGFDMSQWGHLRMAIDEVGSLSRTGAMQRELQDETASSSLTRLFRESDKIEKAVAAADEKLAPVRERIIDAQQAAYFMYRPMM